MLTLVTWVRFAKILAVLMLVSGTVGAACSAPLETRRFFAYRIAGPGLGLTWAFGFVLAYLTGQPLVSAFVITALVLSIVSQHGTLYLAGREDRRTKRAIATALVPLLLATWLMVLRPF